jgi:hypothetical protein
MDLRKSLVCVVLLATLTAAALAFVSAYVVCVALAVEFLAVIGFLVRRRLVRRRMKDLWVKGLSGACIRVDGEGITVSTKEVECTTRWDHYRLGFETEHHYILVANRYELQLVPKQTRDSNHAVELKRVIKSVQLRAVEVD